MHFMVEHLCARLNSTRKGYTSSDQLLILTYRRKTCSFLSFYHASLHLWNSLPPASLETPLSFFNLQTLKRYLNPAAHISELSIFYRICIICNILTHC